MLVRLRLPLVAACLAALALTANATMLRQMSLSDMATRADKVFRGVVVGIDSTTVRAGGSDLPVMVYRFKVVEAFKGGFDSPKGALVVEVRMLGVAKHPPQVGTKTHFAPLQDLPTFQMGRDYVLFTTRPSSIGLSTTVGLGQGAFAIESGSKEELASNTFGNAGLAAPGTGRAAPANLQRGGPIPYADLARAIREVTGGAR